MLATGDSQTSSKGSGQPHTRLYIGAVVLVLGLAFAYSGLFFLQILCCIRSKNRRASAPRRGDELLEENIVPETDEVDPASAMRREGYVGEMEFERMP